jgi:hypothetical protein
MTTNFNIKNWPIVYFKSSENTITDKSFEDFKECYLKLLIKCKNNNEKMVLICDLNTLTSYNMEFIGKQAQFTKEIYKFNKEYLKCVCILCKDKSFKNILNLFFTLVKPAAPYKLCRSFNKVNKFLFDKFNITFNSNLLNNEKEDIEEETDEQEEQEEEYEQEEYEQYEQDEKNE